MNIKIKLCRNGAKLPERKTIGAAACDVYTPEDVVIPHGRSVIPLGFMVEIPEGYGIDSRARSGFSVKGIEGTIAWKWLREFVSYVFGRKMLRFNADVILGLIDSDYRGEIGAIVYNRSVPFCIAAGTRISQLTVQKFESIEWSVADELSETERGEGGFESTGTI